MTIKRNDTFKNLLKTAYRYDAQRARNKFYGLNYQPTKDVFWVFLNDQEKFLTFQQLFVHFIE